VLSRLAVNPSTPSRLRTSAVDALDELHTADTLPWLERWRGPHSRQASHGSRQFMPLVRLDGAGRDYALVVPFDTAHSVIRARPPCPLLPSRALAIGPIRRLHPASSDKIRLAP
jgi:hypothetical protein